MFCYACFTAIKEIPRQWKFQKHKTVTVTEHNFCFHPQTAQTSFFTSNFRFLSSRSDLATVAVTSTLTSLIKTPGLDDWPREKEQSGLDGEGVPYQAPATPPLVSPPLGLHLRPAAPRSLRQPLPPPTNQLRARERQRARRPATKALAPVPPGMDMPRPAPPRASIHPPTPPRSFALAPRPLSLSQWEARRPHTGPHTGPARRHSAGFK